MNRQNFDQIISKGVDAVLETMFFTASMGLAEDFERDEGLVEACLNFHGAPSGALSIRISEASARMLTAGFLGEDEGNLTTSQIGQVVCELANMLCGWLVSHVEGEEQFNLDAPQLLASVSKHSSEIDAEYQQTFALENGTLTVRVLLAAANELQRQN